MHPTVLRVGPVIALDDTLSTYPRGATGYVPLNVYVIRDEESALIIDTGFPAHQSAVLRGLRTALAGTTRIGLFLTRIAEYDCQGNATETLRHFPISVLYATLPAYFLLADRDGTCAFHCEAGDVRAVATAAYRDVQTRLLTEETHVGNELSVALGERLQAIPAPLRLLTTTWLYDGLSKTLFTSDVFTHLIGQTFSDLHDGFPGASPHLTPEWAAKVLSSKFDWLLGANVEPIKEDLGDLFASYDVVNLAPSSGRVVTGRRAVDATLRTVHRALELLQSEAAAAHTVTSP